MNLILIVGTLKTTTQFVKYFYRTMPYVTTFCYNHELIMKVNFQKKKTIMN